VVTQARTIRKVRYWTFPLFLSFAAHKMNVVTTQSLPMCRCTNLKKIKDLRHLYILGFYILFGWFVVAIFSACLHGMLTPFTLEGKLAWTFEIGPNQVTCTFPFKSRRDLRVFKSSKKIDWYVFYSFPNYLACLTWCF